MQRLLIILFLIFSNLAWAGEPTIAELESLRGQNTRESLARIEEGLASEDQQTRVAAAKALKGRRDVESIPVIEKTFLLWPQDESIEAIEAAHMRDDVAALEWLEKGLESTDAERRNAFRRAIEGPNNAATLPILNRVYDRHLKQTKEDIDMRVLIMEAAHGRNDLASLDLLKRGLNDSEHLVQLRAAQSIVVLRYGPKIESFLNEMLTHRNLSVIQMAVSQLVTFNIEYAFRFLNSVDPLIRQIVYRTVAHHQRKDPWYYKFMEMASHDPEAEVRKTAISFLNNSDPKAFDIIERLVLPQSEPDKSVRRRLFESVRNWSHPRAKRILIKMRLDPDKWISEVADLELTRGGPGQESSREQFLLAVEGLLLSENTFDQRAAVNFLYNTSTEVLTQLITVKNLDYLNKLFEENSHLEAIKKDEMIKTVDKLSLEYCISILGDPDLQLPLN